MNVGIELAPAVDAGLAPIVAPIVALVGNPNCGKTALFNALTGSRQKVANYPGVTVEKKLGRLSTPAGRSIQLLDLPGTYSLRARSPDEEDECGDGRSWTSRSNARFWRCCSNTWRSGPPFGGGISLILLVSVSSGSPEWSAAIR